MSYRLGQNCIVTTDIEEGDHNDHLDNGDRVRIVALDHDEAYVSNRIGSKAWVRYSFLRPTRGRPMRVGV
jgi:hypothetical protein